MIEYEYPINESPFFKANQSYCEKVTSYFSENQIEFSGHCNSYGYEINADLRYKNHQYSIKCYKFQTTQNGVIIPVNAHESLGVTVHGSGFNKDVKLKYSRSKFRRLFMNERYKEFIATPFYLKANFDQVYELQQIANLFAECKVFSFSLKNGKIKIRIFAALTNPLYAIKELGKMNSIF